MQRFVSFVLTLCLGASFAVTLSANARAAVPTVTAGDLAGLSWRLVGPTRAGREIAVTGVIGHPNRFYFGAVDGGVWETNNAGRTWDPIFDAVHIGSIGAIAVAPSDSNVVYVGSGEADMRSSLGMGDGMYRSNDGGAHWQRAGLTHTQAIGRIVVDPRNANVAYAAVLGKPYAASTQRGLFKTVDGGKTWTRVLYHNDLTGAIDVSIDPSNPSIVYAALWQAVRPPWNTYPPESGPGSGLYKSTDGGATWTQLTNGLPAHVGRIGVSVSPSNPQRIYARIDAKTASKGGVYRSDDAGATWHFMAGGLAQVRIWERGWYFGEIVADPKNPDVVYVMDTSTYRSTDGGRSWSAIKGAPGGDDYHALWIDPNNTAHLILGSDQGTVISLDGAKTWSSWYNQPTAQLYHIAADNRFPYHIYGSQQDSGAIDVPSASKYAHISFRDWKPIDVGGENGYLAPDPLHPGYVYGASLGDVGDTVTLERLKTGWERNLDPVLNHPKTIWRSTWTEPLVFSPLDPHALYFAHQNIFVTHNGGRNWTIISPDLTRPGTPRRGVVYSLAPSPINSHLLWAGTDDGYLWVTRDSGAHWKNVTPPALTPWSKVTEIAASHFSAGTAYAAVDRHRLNDMAPYLYKTSDYGAHWTMIANGIPSKHFLNAITEDTQRPGLLYAGTERGISVSFNDGASWQSLRLNLPTTSVRDVLVHGNDLIAGTFGRGIWILDNGASLLRQMHGTALTANAYLFAPTLTFRLRPGNDEGTPIPADEPQMNNPSVGVSFDYVLHEAATTPLTLTVRNAAGRVLRRWSSSDKPIITDPQTVDIPAYWLTPILPPSAALGAHRFIWGFHDKNARGPLVPPGTYRVTLTVDGHSQSQNFRIARDPRLTVPRGSLAKQYAFSMAVEQRFSEIATLQTRAQALLKRPGTSPMNAMRLRVEILGQAPKVDPSNSVGVASHDVQSLRFLRGEYALLYADAQSADAAPTATMQSTLQRLDAILHAASAKLTILERMR